MEIACFQWINVIQNSLTKYVETHTYIQKRTCCLIFGYSTMKFQFLLCVSISTYKSTYIQRHTKCTKLYYHDYLQQSIYSCHRRHFSFCRYHYYHHHQISGGSNTFLLAKYSYRPLCVVANVYRVIFFKQNFVLYRHPCWVLRPSKAKQLKSQ